MAPAEDDEQGGIEAALLVLDELMTGEWPEVAADLAHSPEDEQLGASELPPVNQQPRRKRSKSQGFKQPAAGASAGKKALSWDPNKARNERKGELIYLRKRVSDLELKLQRLMNSSRSPGDEQGSSPRSLLEDVDTAMVASEPTTDCIGRHVHGTSCMWRGVAHRQCQERLKAERENVRLKLVLEKQLKIARTLDKIVSKKAAIKELEQFMHDMSNESEAPSSPMQDNLEPGDSTELQLRL